MTGTKAEEEKAGSTALPGSAYRFTLFSALRWLEAQREASQRFGETRRIQDEPVRLSQLPTMRFSPSEVAALDETGPRRLRVEGFGLFGANGPLPLHLTEFADTRARQHGDAALADFIGFLQHRMTTLFYRAWAMGEPSVDVDLYRSAVASMMGLGGDGLARRDSVDDGAKIHVAARYAPAARSQAGLEDILSGFFRRPVKIEALEPRWLDIPQSARTRLGVAGNGRLGVDATTGSRSWQCQFSFRVIVPDLRYAQFEELLPGGSDLPQLRDLVVLYAGKELRWAVELRLQPSEVPPLRLSSKCRLGWSTWIGRREKRLPRVKIHDMATLPAHRQVERGVERGTTAHG